MIIRNSSNILSGDALADMDNALVNFSGTFELELKKVLPQEAFFTRKPNKFWIEDSFDEKYHGQIHEMICQPGFFAKMKPMPGAIKAFHEMIRSGLRITICTTPHHQSLYCEAEKEEWVKKHLGSDYSQDIKFAHDKTVVPGQILIDDNPDITGKQQSNPTWRHVLFDAPYNKHVATEYRLVRWRNWRRIITKALKNPR